MIGVRNLGDLASFRTGKLNSNAATPDGAYPFFTCSQETYRTDTCAFDTECVLLAGNNANGIYPIKYFSGKFDAYQRTYVIESLDQTALVTRYLYFALQPQLAHLRSVSTGSATKFLTLPILRGLQIRLPSLAVQRRIASILSAYDDLIENNTRRIAILEEMARRIYEEWFVRFRFPGHENVRMVETELGLLPEDWSSQRLDATFKFGTGKPINKADRESGSVPVYGANGVIGHTKQAPLSTHCVVLGKIGSCGALHRPIEPCFVSNNAFFVEAHDPEGYEYMDLTLRGIDYKQYIGGAANPYMPLPSFGHHLIARAPRSVETKFHHVVAPMFELQASLQRRCANLRLTRDLLLPKLISGELDVSAMPEPETFAA